MAVRIERSRDGANPKARQRNSRSFAEVQQAPIMGYPNPGFSDSMAPQPPKKILRLSSGFEHTQFAEDVPILAVGGENDRLGLRPLLTADQWPFSREGKERYPDYAEQPIKVYFLLSSVFPRLMETTQRVVQSGSAQEKWQYFAGLIQAYSIVEALPDPVQQSKALLAHPSANGEHLNQVRGMMEEINQDKTNIFSQAQDWDKRTLRRNTGYARRNIKGSLAEENIVLKEDKRELPSPLVTELAFLNSMITIFRADASEQFPELNRKTAPKTRIEGRMSRRERKALIASYVSGLLREYDASQAVSSDTEHQSNPFYRKRLQALQERLDAKRQGITTKQVPTMSSSQQHKEVRKALKNVAHIAEMASLVENTGLNGEMVRDAKGALVKESAWSALWMVGVEAAQQAQGLLGGGLDVEKHLHTNDIRLLLAEAVVSRLVTLGLLGVKGGLSKEITKLKGIAPDLLTKASYEKSGKPLLGFIGYSALIELYFVLNSFVGGAFGGLKGVAGTEISTDWGPFGVPRQIVENIKVYKQLKKEKKKLNGEITEADRLTSPQNTVEVNLGDIKGVNGSDVSGNSSETISGIPDSKDSGPPGSGEHIIVELG